MLPIKTISYNIESQDQPIDLYLKLKTKFSDKELFILESLSGPDKDKQQALIGFNPVFTFKIVQSNLILSGLDEICLAVTNKITQLNYLKQLSQNEFKINDLKQVWDLLRQIEAVFKIDYQGPKTNVGIGFFGYFAYDTIRYVEDLPYLIENKSNIPELILSIYQGLYLFDFSAKKQFLVINDFDIQDKSALVEYDTFCQLQQLAAISLPALDLTQTFKPEKVTDSTNRQKFFQQVKKAMEHIAIGDIYQIQIGHSLKVKTAIEPFTVYLRKRELNPSPYMYYTQMEDLTIIGASPELFIRIKDNDVTMRPIAGTIKRGKNEEEDDLLKQELKNDKKEQAEHIMLVDLGRNDIGRICQTNTLEVTELMVIEKYSHVFHIVSNIIGKLIPNLDKYDVLAATIPAGTVSGAPKIRAMELIEEIETARRELYAGCIGFIDFNGNIETALCIRTSFFKDGVYSTQASAGIVADSIAEKEWIETLSKMSSSYKAITGLELKNENFVN